MGEAGFLPKNLRTEAQRPELFRDWGSFLAKKNLPKLAVSFFDESLNLSQDPKSFYERSIVKSQIGNVQGALDDAIAARNLHTWKPYALAECKALFELNRFEDTEAQLHTYIHEFRNLGAQTDIFENELCFVHSTYDDCLSKHFGPYLLKNSSYLDTIIEYFKNKNYVETRPLWKVLKSQSKCDVLSILEKENVLEKLSPIQIARRVRSFRVRAQNYFPRAWRDVLLFEKFKNDDKFKNAHPLFHKQISQEYENVLKFMEMLHLRNPLYNINGEKLCSPIWHRMHDNFLKRVQYQTRRDMFKILKTLRAFKERGQIEKMRAFIEDVTANWVTIKTYRIMPWKIEFLREVYNLLALTVLDSYKVPPNLRDVPLEYQMHVLLKLPMATTVSKTYEFGKRTASTENLEATAAYKEKVARYEKRLKFTKFSLEKCYLHYEIASVHIKNGHSVECSTAAYKGLKEASSMRNVVWEILCLLLIVKAHTIMDKYTHERKGLLITRSIARKLNNEQLMRFFDKCVAISDYRKMLNESERKSCAVPPIETSGSSLRNTV